MGFILKTRLVTVVDDISTGLSCRLARKAKGLSIQELADRLGWSKCFQSRLERGQRRWSAERVKLINKALKD